MQESIPTIKTDRDALPGSFMHRLFDIWNRRDLGRLPQPVRVTLEPDDVLFVRYSQ